MKKCLILILIAALLFTMSGCTDAAKENPDNAEETSISAEEAAPEPTVTTLMVYMVGSDLESKSGAGTQDLQEMLESGIDLEHVNLLVYAGGSPAWHNDYLKPEQHTLLWLTADGFQPITATDTYSMGDPQCLSTFLQYGYDNFPADRYALILWDHGNGPVIGYGKDMLFENDGLTLKEMSEALAASPFSGETRLAWIGFDACLMASAELACVLEPYADYLVASQEVEPAFGWNYRFLSDVAATETPRLLEQITSEYMEACLAYFTERGYEDRDVTLSCFDLSKAAQLKEAISTLFDKAKNDVGAEFNQLAARRVNTRALGKATTGSDYDLVDLRDMAMWLGEMYPEEATALINAIDEVILTNSTNAQELCGVSLYYPFYNKVYYERDWSAAYAQLDAFPSYGEYLEAYARIWLGNDKLLETASSASPKEDHGAYTLQLTEEQNANLASAKYRILIRDGEEYYNQIFASSDVENDNGLLTANFDGNILYAVDDYGNYNIPIARELDRVGDTGRYMVPVTLTNGNMDLYIMGDFEFEFQTYRYYLNIHKNTGEVTVSSIAPYTGEEDILEGGKKEEADLSKWSNIYFYHLPHQYLTRYENGAIMPVDQWPEDSVITGTSRAFEDGMRFEYLPLVSGDYYLLFEMEDTQGNRYCSELLPIHSDGVLPDPVADPDPIELDWNSGDEILLTDSDGVKVWLQKIKGYSSEGYGLRAENSNDYPVVISGADVYCGDTLYCSDYFGFLEVPAGGSNGDDIGRNLGDISYLELDRDISSFTFTLDILHGISSATLHHNPYTVNLSDDTRLIPDDYINSFYYYDQPVYGYRAEKQVLLDDPELYIELLGIGGNGMDTSIRGALYLENRTDIPADVNIEGILLDNFFCPIYTAYVTIPANSGTYIRLEANNAYLPTEQFTDIQNVKLLLRRYEYAPLYSGNSPSVISRLDVAAAESSSKSSVLQQGQLLYNKKGLRVELIASKLDYGYSSNWSLLVTNTTGQDIALRSLDATTETGEDCSTYAYMSNKKIPDGSSGICTLKHSNYDTDEPIASMNFRLQVLDFKEEAILFETDEVITLYTPPAE